MFCTGPIDKKMYFCKGSITFGMDPVNGVS